MPSYYCVDAPSSTRFVSAYNELLRCLKLRGGCLATASKTWTDPVTQSDLNAMRSAMYTMGHIQFIDMDAVEAALAVSSDQPSTLFTDNYLWKDVTDSTPFEHVYWIRLQLKDANGKYAWSSPIVLPGVK